MKCDNNKIVGIFYFLYFNNNRCFIIYKCSLFIYSKENSGINKIEINITTKENADNANISKIINNFLPEKYFQKSIIFNN